MIRIKTILIEFFIIGIIIRGTQFVIDFSRMKMQKWPAIPWDFKIIKIIH